MKKAFAYCAALLALPFVASAHEVYVLTPDEIHTGLTTPAFSELQTIAANMHQFMLWGFVAFVVISTVFCVSVWHRLEQAVSAFFVTIRPYAPTISRISVALSLIAGAYYNALFGPELPLWATFGTGALAARITLLVIGCMLLVGVWDVAAAAVLFVLFCVEVLQHGTYMFTYTNYAGEALALMLLAHKRYAKYSFPLLRVAFGIGLLYASYYAKILHNGLALQVASLPLAGHAHSLAYYLGFEPHFLVLGAAIIEVLVGIFFILGFEIRWTALFMLFWLSLSLWYFGESVWPHIILIGVGIAFFCHGYDRYSLEGYLLDKDGREPVL